MKMAQKWLSALLVAILFGACNVNGDYKTTEFKLHGTWESTDTSLYSGELVIGVDTITIIGYAEKQTPSVWEGGDDAKRPFRDFAKNAPIPCHTDDGKLFIMTVGGEKIVPYLYSTSDQGKFLFFTFGNRGEALKWIGN
jgi:hypothetical protein